MTGNRMAHPLLISLANLRMNFRMKSSKHAFLLSALLPVPSFIHQTKLYRGQLGDRLIHECFSFILEPLKTAASIGIMMSDPLGCRRFCFTPLAAYIYSRHSRIDTYRWSCREELFGDIGFI